MKKETLEILAISSLVVQTYEMNISFKYKLKLFVTPLN